MNHARQPWRKPAGADLTPRPASYSRSRTSRLMEMLDSNLQGNVHGGVIMRMVDEAAGIVAIKHAQQTVVTAAVERFDFVAPAYIGDVVTIDCELERVGRSSMQVGVIVTAEDLVTREVREVARSRVIYVAIDENGKPTPVPPLAPTEA